MFTLDMSLQGEELYPRDKLKLSRQGPKRRWYLETEMKDGENIVRQAVRDIFQKHGFSEEKKGEWIEITNFTLAWPLAVVLGESKKFFRKVYLVDRSGRVEV